MFVQLQLSTSPSSLKHSQPPHRCLRKSASHPQHVPSTIQPSSNVHRHSTAHGAFSRTVPAADPSRVADDGRASCPRNGGATLSEAKQNLSQKLKEFSQVAKTQGDEVGYVEYTLHSPDCYDLTYALSVEVRLLLILCFHRRQMLFSLVHIFI